MLYRLHLHGFVRTGRCQHHSLLLAELGWLPDLDTEPEPPTPAAPAMAVCPDCNGSKYVRIYRSGKLSDWVAGSCHRCQNPGQVAAA